MPAVDDHDIVLAALRAELDRCLAIMRSGREGFERITQSASVNERSGRHRAVGVSRDLRAAALDGAETGLLAAAVGTPDAMHDVLLKQTSTLRTDKDLLTAAAFVAGYLHNLTPADALAAMQYTAEQPGERLLYSRACFPPAMRSMAVGLAGVGTPTQRLAAAAEIAGEPRFVLPDARQRLLGFATQDWGPNIENLVWACPHPRYTDSGGDDAVIESFDQMIDRSPGLQRTTGFALLATDPRLPPPAASQRGEHDAERFLQGLRRAQLSYTVYSGGQQPKHLLLTDWSELADRAGAGETPAIDHVVRMAPVRPGAAIGDISSHGRMSEITVPLGDAFPVNGVDTSLLISRVTGGGHHDTARHRLADALVRSMRGRTGGGQVAPRKTQGH